MYLEGESSSGLHYGETSRIEATGDAVTGDRVAFFLSKLDSRPPGDKVSPGAFGFYASVTQLVE